MDLPDGFPVSGVTAPALGMSCFGIAIDFLTTRQDLQIVARVALRRGDESDRAVQMRVVVPIDEPADPGARTEQIGKNVLGIFRPILQRAEQRLRIEIVIAHRGTAERGHDAERVQGREQGRAFHRAAII